MAVPTGLRRISGTPRGSARFFVRCVPPTKRAVLAEADPIRMRAPVLGIGIVPVLALVARQCNDLSRHRSGPTFRSVNISDRTGTHREEYPAVSPSPQPDYSIISAITPEPTVRPPSRIAKRNPFSMAMGVISSASMATLSPGMTISVPVGNVATPVTSVVRK